MKFKILLIIGFVIDILILISLAVLLINIKKTKVIEDWGLVYADGSVQKVDAQGTFSTVGVVGVVDMREVKKFLKLEKENLFKFVKSD